LDDAWIQEFCPVEEPGHLVARAERSLRRARPLVPLPDQLPDLLGIDVDRGVGDDQVTACRDGIQQRGDDSPRIAVVVECYLSVETIGFGLPRFRGNVTVASRT
jgi:hypothetical protein